MRALPKEISPKCVDFVFQDYFVGGVPFFGSFTDCRSSDSHSLVGGAAQTGPPISLGLGFAGFQPKARPGVSLPTNSRSRDCRLVLAVLRALKTDRWGSQPRAEAKNCIPSRELKGSAVRFDTAAHGSRWLMKEIMSLSIGGGGAATISFKFFVAMGRVPSRKGRGPPAACA